MCKENSVCRGASINGQKNLFLLFTGINIILSFITCFLLASKTKHYKEAKQLLAQMNNNNIDNEIYNFCLSEYKDKKYCEIDGKKLLNPKENISHQCLFKKFKGVEIALDILIILFYKCFLIFSFKIFYKFTTVLESDNILNQKIEEKDTEKAKKLEEERKIEKITKENL